VGVVEEDAAAKKINNVPYFLSLLKLKNSSICFLSLRQLQRSKIQKILHMNVYLTS